MNNMDKIYNAIKIYWDTYGYAPSVRDLCEMTGLKSTASVTYYLDIMKNRGQITYDNYVSRSIKINNYPDDMNYNKGVMDTIKLLKNILYEDGAISTIDLEYVIGELKKEVI